MLKQITAVGVVCEICHLSGPPESPDTTRYQWVNPAHYEYLTSFFDRVESRARKVGFVCIKKPSEALLEAQGVDGRISYRMNNTRYLCRPCAKICSNAVAVEIKQRPKPPKPVK
jgi:hypothetical protein